MIEEIWMDIQGYEESYQVSNLGRIRSKNRLDSSGHKLKEMIRKPHKTRHGYLLVNLCKNGKVKHLSVHRLVAEAFLPNPDNKTMVNHIDGNKSNNHLSNLEWVTRAENVAHAIETGLFKAKGEFNPRAKVTEEQVKEMRMLRNSDPKKYTFKKLGEKYGITSAMVSDIANRHSWKHII